MSDMNMYRMFHHPPSSRDRRCRLMIDSDSIVPLSCLLGCASSASKHRRAHSELVKEVGNKKGGGGGEGGKERKAKESLVVDRVGCRLWFIKSRID
eukprot:scaffold129257_cov54-Attheya_sp.AAC.4